jgi:uncharacterized membrane-anchored protein YhcB (DUF1043 family)
LVEGLQEDAGGVIALFVGFIILRLTFVFIYEMQTAGTYKLHQLKNHHDKSIKQPDKYARDNPPDNFGGFLK